jgi:hypothetical protein
MIETDHMAQEWLLPEADAHGVLGIAAEWVLFSREAERLKVRAVLKWAELHPAAGEDAACWGQVDGSDCDVPINREGCPGVLSSSVAELAAAMQMTTAAALYLLDACLEVKFRLPRIHRRFERLEVDLAKVRLVTRLTEKLGPDAAAFVDAQLAPRIHRVGRRAIEAAVALAIVRFHPELADAKARDGKAGWHVDVHHPDLVDFASTSQLDASADSLDVEDFMAALSMVAEDLARYGDHDTRGQRLAKSLGIIGRAMTGRPGHPGPEQRPEPDNGAEAPEPADAAPDESRGVPAPRDIPVPDDGDGPTDEGEVPPGPDEDRRPDDLDDLLRGDADAPAPAGDADGTRAARTGDALQRLPKPQSPQRRRRAGITVHAHLHTDATSGATTAVYHLPGLGVVSEEAFGRWLDSHGVKVTRVIDLNRRQSVNQHDPPPAMRDQVRERDKHCVFPGCEVPAEACDCDHIVPYDENGPPGQTNPDGLACLCRMHHLFKTHNGWRYGRLPDHSYLWVSPTGRVYSVNRDGTTWAWQNSA